VREAARTLQAAGAREVLVWAVARTPPVVDGPS
jgi:predicted amidophosphoribosyltransferase